MGGPQVLWHLLPILLVGVVGFLVFSVRLKVVRMDDEALYVSNYRKEIRVPFSEVESVGGWFTKRLVTIHFRMETEFGRKVSFMPELRWFDLDVFGPHPIIAELEDAIHRKAGR